MNLGPATTEKLTKPSALLVIWSLRYVYLNPRYSYAPLVDAPVAPVATRAEQIPPSFYFYHLSQKPLLLLLLRYCFFYYCRYCCRHDHRVEAKGFSHIFHF